MYNLKRPRGGHDLPFRKGGLRFADIIQGWARPTSPTTRTSVVPVAHTDDPFQALEGSGGPAGQVHGRHGPAPVHG